jgi:hypothetical protein
VLPFMAAQLLAVGLALFTVRWLLEDGKPES